MLNETAQRLTGWAEAEAIAQDPAHVLLFLSDKAAHEARTLPVAEILHGEIQAVSMTDVSLRRKDGTRVAVEASATPVTRLDGTVRGVVVVFRDVTQQRQTQAALLKTEKLAVAGRLAATIAHEIHNPLDATINLLYLLRHEPSVEERDQFLDLAASELDRVAKISHAMLGMYRESRTPVPVEMGTLLRSLLLLLERNFVQAQVQVQTEFDEPAVVSAFPAELRQVFMNLLNNALDASTTGGHVLVRLSRSTKWVSVMVRDEGAGIEPDTMERMFQPFFTTKGERGTGLGLWVSQGIVEKHGGTLTVETRTEGEAHGTDMIVRLPV
jgi:PAS domain S-box-containing protein